MIKVLHLRDTKKVCGPGKTILETVSRIDTDEFRLIIGLFLEKNENDNLYMKTAMARNIPVLPIRFRNRLDLSVIFHIITIIKENRIDILHSHEYKSDIIAYLVSKLYKIPTVTTIHGWITNTIKGKINIGLGKKVLPAFTKVIAVSPQIRAELLRSGVPEGKIALVYNAIVAENYVPGSYEPDSVRRRFNLPPSAILIGNVGRLSPEKGQKDFLLAAEMLCRTTENVYFILVGDGGDRQELQHFAEQHNIADRVFFTGHVEDVRPIYQDLDYVALTSHTEGFPNVVLESLCMDTPVLATDVGGVGDIIFNNTTGLLIPPHAPEAIYKGLLDLIHHPQNSQKMAAAGKKRVQENFLFAKRVAAVETIYREVVAGSRYVGQLSQSP